MEKQLIESLNWRRAIKSFDPSKKVSQEQLDTLLESLRLSASSFGLQLWKFVVVTKPELKEKLVPASWNQKQVQDASHVIVFTTPEDYSTDHLENYLQSVADTRGVPMESLDGYRSFVTGFVEKMNLEQRHNWMKQQAYLALGNLLTSAALLKVDACPMEGFDPVQYGEILGLGEMGLRAVVVCPLGFRSSEDKHAGDAKVRFPKEEVIKHLA